jgi:hypothetical protein
MQAVKRRGWRRALDGGLVLLVPAIVLETLVLFLPLGLCRLPLAL